MLKYFRMLWLDRGIALLCGRPYYENIDDYSDVIIEEIARQCAVSSSRVTIRDLHVEKDGHSLCSYLCGHGEIV